MDFDRQTAAALGFAKPDYVAVERERRWLCREVPRAQIIESDAITDLYVTGTRLRLREARPVDGGVPMLRLSRKADVEPRTRLVTSIYLPEDEFAVLAAALPGVRIAKLRHRLEPVQGAVLLVDEFQGGLEGLVLAEAACGSEEQLAAFEMPDFALYEVTEDPRFTGAQLARYGRPKDV